MKAVKEKAMKVRQLIHRIKASRDSIEAQHGQVPLCYGLSPEKNHPECSVCLDYEGCNRLSLKLSNPRIAAIVAARILDRTGTSAMAVKVQPKAKVAPPAAPAKKAVAKPAAAAAPAKKKKAPEPVEEEETEDDLAGLDDDDIELEEEVEGEEELAEDDELSEDDGEELGEEVADEELGEEEEVEEIDDGPSNQQLLDAIEELKAAHAQTHALVRKLAIAGKVLAPAKK
jgi:hypothetical protein